MDENMDDFKNVGKVYLVWYDNGESYEDAFSYVERVFTNKEAAVRYLDERFMRNELRGYKGEEQTWSNEKFVCSMNNMDCEDCPKGGAEDLWDCDEFESRMDDEWNNSFWYVQEMELWE